MSEGISIAVRLRRTGCLALAVLLGACQSTDGPSPVVIPNEELNLSRSVQIPAEVIALAVGLYAFYVRHLAGRWRAIYVVTAVIGLYLNVFVLVVQLFTKIDALAAITGVPPAGPVFGGVQLLVLIGFILAGRLAVKRYRAVPA